MARERAEKRRLRLTDKQKQQMLAGLIRKEQAFLAAKGQLKVEYFNEVEEEYALVWSTVEAYYDEFQQLPAKEELIIEIDRLLDEDPGRLPEQRDMRRLRRFVTRSYAMPFEALKLGAIRKCLRLFLEDRVAQKIRDKFRVAEYIPADMFKVLSGLVEEAGTARAAGDGEVTVPFPEGWNKVPLLQKKSTGLDFLDDLLEGGAAPGEVYVLLGPYSSCKTLLAVQITACGARRAVQAWRASGKQIPLDIFYLVSFEEPVASLQIRALSYTSMIDRRSLESGREEDLSTPDNPKPYEESKGFKEQFDDLALRSEARRWELSQQSLNIAWRILDMGIGPGMSHRGGGHVEEVAALIRRDQEDTAARLNTECRVGGIGGDYLGAAVDRHIEKNELDNSEVRMLTKRYPLRAKRAWAQAFGCPVYLFHQLAGAAQDLGPGKIAKRTDSAESKAVMENADFGFVIGNPTPNQLCGIRRAKQRRAPGDQLTVVVRIEGAFCRVVDVRAEFVLDDHTKRIVRREDLMRYNAGVIQDGEPSEGFVEMLHGTLGRARE